MDNETIYTNEYYSVVKKNELMNFAGKWMELEKMNEVVQTQKDKYHISLIRGSYLQIFIFFQM